MLYVWLVLSLIIAIAIVLIIKISHLLPQYKHILLFLALLLLVCDLYVSYRLYESKSIGKLYTTVKGLSVIVIYILGVFLFDEDYSVWTVAGTLLIITGIYLI